MSIIDDYLSNVVEPQKSQLQRIRRIVHQLVLVDVLQHEGDGFLIQGIHGANLDTVSMNAHSLRRSSPGM